MKQPTALSRNPLLSFLLFFCLQACSMPSCGSILLPPSNANPPQHQAFTSLLQKHVDEQGMVDYKGFLRDREQLKAYLETLESNPPNPQEWSEAEQLAYWINAYNAYTIDLILEHYPLKSIKDIGSAIQVPFVNSPWDIKFINIKGKKFDLNNLEHNIIREEFNEPRIHFALVCAARSCPKLRREAYTAEKLDAQLSQQAKQFLTDPAKNRIGEQEVQLSKLFNWYQGDFTKKGSLIDFLNKYAPLTIQPDAEISYLDYDWRLNEQ
jgi:hypothetical protein